MGNHRQCDIPHTRYHKYCDIPHTIFLNITVTMFAITTLVFCVVLLSPLTAADEDDYNPDFNPDFNPDLDQDCLTCRSYTGFLYMHLRMGAPEMRQKKLLNTKLCPGVVEPQTCYKFVENVWLGITYTAYNFLLDMDLTCAGAKETLCKKGNYCINFLREVTKKETHGDRWQKVIGHIKKSDECVTSRLCYDNVEEFVPQALRIVFQDIAEGAPEVCQNLREDK